MRDWAQWLIDHNMRYLVLALYLMSVPVAVIIHVIVAAIREVISEACELPRMIKSDVAVILGTKKGK